jgi:hypothetical protein
LGRVAELRQATLLEIDEEDGILYPPHSQVSTFDPTPYVEEPIGYRLPGETLGEGMFLIWPILGASDLGAIRAAEGRYSRKWKEQFEGRDAAGARRTLAAAAGGRCRASESSLVRAAVVSTTLDGHTCAAAATAFRNAGARAR